jgi:hypothetical protein
MYRFSLIWSLCSLVTGLSGQSYFTTGGIRMGSDFGLSLKQRILKRTTAEFILHAEQNSNSNLGFSGIYKKHRPILTRNFNLFYGAGVHWKWEERDQDEIILRTRSFGIPLQAGIEFTIGRINLSWDYTPILYISSNSNAFASSKGFSIRYVFINQKEGRRLMKKLESPFEQKKKKRKRKR